MNLTKLDPVTVHNIDPFRFHGLFAEQVGLVYDIELSRKRRRETFNEWMSEQKNRFVGILAASFIPFAWLGKKEQTRNAEQKHLYTMRREYDSIPGWPGFAIMELKLGRTCCRFT